MNQSRSVRLLVALLLAPTSVAGQAHALHGVVLADGRPVEGAVVYVELDSGGGLAAAAADTAVVDQRNLRFLPPVVAGQPGLTVEFLNSDPILHNVFSPDWTGETFDLGTYPSNASRHHTFVSPGPHVILCHVHPEMAAYIVVVSTPLHAVTGPEGEFRIEGLPAGPHRVEIWRRGSEVVSREVTVPEAGSFAVTLELDELER